MLIEFFLLFKFLVALNKIKRIPRLKLDFSNKFVVGCEKKPIKKW